MAKGDGTINFNENENRLKMNKKMTPEDRITCGNALLSETPTNPDDPNAGNDQSIAL